MPNYVIRLARPGDLEGVYAVFSQVESMHRQAHPEIFRKADDDPADIKTIKDYLLSGLRTADAVVFVAEVGGDIVGAVLAWVRQTPENPLLVKRTYLNVSDLVVAADHRQQGIGRALMENVHNWAQEHNLDVIQLTVWNFNEGALAFYRKLGYEILHQHLRKELP